MENRALATTNVNNGLNFSAKEIETIKKTVAVGASDEELNMFLSLASTYDLNPFLKEIWCIKMGGRAVITTSRDGYLRIANRDSHFRGMVSDVVYSNDSFQKTKDGVEHSYKISNRGQIVGAYALVYRDDRLFPSYFFAPYKDYYNKKNATWDIYPHAMILKVAEAMALKRAFSISGLVTQEEIGEVSQQNTTPQNTQVPNKAVLLDLWKRYLVVCGSPENAKEAMKKITGKDSSKNFTDEDLQKLEEDIIQREYEATPDEEFFEAETVDEPQKEEVTTQEEISA